MSSSAPKLQEEAAPASRSEPLPFCYADAQVSGGTAATDIEQAAEECTRRRETEAFERGRQAAQQQLRASLDTAIAQVRDQVIHILADFAGERSAYYRRVEGEVVQLALAIARKVLHRECQIDPNALTGIVRVTLEKLDAASKVDLYVQPQEATEWRHYFACQADGAPIPEVHEDPSLSSGQCRIETSLGSTEIGIESQLREIETGLLDLLAERPDSTTSKGLSTPQSAHNSGRPA